MLELKENCVNQQLPKSGSSISGGPPNTLRSNSGQPIFLEVEMHPFLNFKANEENPYRATFESKQGYTYGIEIVNEVVEDRINLL